MSRLRTTPVTRTPVAKDYVMQFGVVMAYNDDGTPNTDEIKFVYVVNNTDENNVVVDSQKREVDFSIWPAAIKTDLKAIYARVLADAENQGLMGAGTDTDDLP